MPILRIVIPTNDWQGILRLKHVGNRGIVHNNYILHGSTQSSQVLNEGIVDKGAVLSEEFIGAQLLGVKDSYKGVRILAKGCSKDNEFVVFVHSLEELSDSRSH